MTTIDSRTIQKRINELEEYMEKSGDYSDKIIAEINGLKFLLQEPVPKVGSFDNTIEGESPKPIFPIKNVVEEEKPVKKKTVFQKMADNIVGIKHDDSVCEHFFMPTNISMGENFVIVVCSKCLELRRVGEQ